MKLLLTGGLGFIGRNFLLHRPADWHVTAVDITEDARFARKIKNTVFIKADLRDADKVKKLSKRIGDRFSACVFLAANGDPALSVPDPAWDLDATTKTLINVCQGFTFNRFIYFSSGAVYNGLSGLISPTKPIAPTLPYAISHKASEEYTRFYHQAGRIDKYIIIRFFGAYGPYEPPRKIYTRLIKQFTSSNNTTYAIKGDGKNYIDAMYIEDAVAGIISAIKSKRCNLTVDFCKGDHPTINQLVVRAGQAFDKRVAVSHMGEVTEYNRFYASPKEFEKLFHFKPKITLEEGLNKLYKFYAK